MDIKLTKKELEIIIDMYETVVPTWSDDFSDEAENLEGAIVWCKTIKKILKRNGFNPNQIFEVKK